MFPIARIAAAFGLVLLTGLAAAAQAEAKYKLGLVTFQGPGLADHVDYVRQGLLELDYVEGRDYEIEAAFVDGDKERAEQFFRGLIERKVDLIIAWTTPAGQIAKRATQTIPVVLITSDPVAAKLVDSLARPGGNLTGISMSSPDLAGKRVEFLREILPGLRAIGFIGNAKSPNAPVFLRQTQAAADRFGIATVAHLVQDPIEIDAALLAGMKAAGAEALVVQPVLTGQADRISALATVAGLPVIADHPPFAEAGALLTYGADLGAHLHRASYFVGRILKGADPADLPIERPNLFPMIVNIGTAQALGLTIPASVLDRADRVIE